jgi:hypothetical membrane protein
VNSGAARAWVGWAVLGAVALYIGALAALGALTPGYEQSQRLISELGEVSAPFASIWRATLIYAGGTLFALAFALHRAIAGSRSVWGPALVATIGSGLVLGGIFQCDPSCAPVTFAGWMHILTSIPATLAALAGPFVFARRLRGDPTWASLARPSVYFGIAGVVTIVAAFVIFPRCGIAGIGQRIATGCQMAWVSMLALRLTRSADRYATPSAARYGGP